MKKKELWRYVVFGLSVAYIIFMWVRRDIGGVWATVPADQLLPMALTSVAVTAIKVALLAGCILVLKWILSKLKR